eukprot:CAMPEP_0177628090 /NCGR_PEP_ID=MMETSP0419_2-20121207/31563_1 /TAXON_ID=582737 /ORGANISM="Tetraselmis sp., Strain GSL018" /LENGTH=85 /DNA_ID=CAMNT_0019129311 /DNA_START=323 /DNA_END=580 /DNA_ORIENTATION=-
MASARMSALTAAVCPRSEAHSRGVMPDVFPLSAEEAEGGMSVGVFSARRDSTASISPSLAARQSLSYFSCAGEHPACKTVCRLWQ